MLLNMSFINYPLKKYLRCPYENVRLSLKEFTNSVRHVPSSKISSSFSRLTIESRGSWTVSLMLLGHWKSSRLIGLFSETAFQIALSFVSTLFSKRRNSAGEKKEGNCQTMQATQFHPTKMNFNKR